MNTQEVINNLVRFEGILSVTCVDSGAQYLSDLGVESHPLLRSILRCYTAWEKEGAWRIYTPECAIFIDNLGTGYLAVAHIKGHPVVKSLARMVRRSLRKVEKQHVALAQPLC